MRTVTAPGGRSAAVSGASWRDASAPCSAVGWGRISTATTAQSVVLLNVPSTTVVAAAAVLSMVATDAMEPASAPWKIWPRRAYPAPGVRVLLRDTTAASARLPGLVDRSKA